MNKNEKKVVIKKHNNIASNYLYNIVLPKTNKNILENNLNSLKRGDKKNLYFLYSEYFNRAFRNKSYRDIFTEDDIYAIDGAGVEWANYRLKGTFYNRLYNSKYSNKILITISLIINFFHGIYYFFSKKNSFYRTHNKVVLGRDFKDTIIEIAIKKQWRTLLVGSFSESSKKKIERVYPNLDFSIWSMPPDSKFMRDQSAVEVEKESNLKSFAKILYRHTLLNKNNLFDHYPQFSQLIELLKNESFELILFSCGGMSGKQEFIMDNIKHNPDIDYILTVGLGAAFDHLGAGMKQKKTPEFVSGLGLEWLYRIFSNPTRTVRIIDSILYFWYLVSLYPFKKNYHKTEINK